MTPVSGSFTVGIDIGTTATKAVAADSRGGVLARSRVSHSLSAPAPDLLEHDATRAWRRGPVQALKQVTAQLGGAEPSGVCVAGMVPSLAAVTRRGLPITPGLLYGDRRGLQKDALVPGRAVMPDAEGFMRWAARTCPDAYGYWPAQAVANYALGRVPAVDSAVSMSLGALMRAGQWDLEVLAGMGVRESQLPVVVPMGGAAGKLTGTDAVLAGGTVDALCDQIVSGAEQPGDVLVICGATLIVWAVVTDWVDVPGLWTVPHTVAGRVLVGGPSNAGALFVDWARGLLGRLSNRSRFVEAPLPDDPTRVPVWMPYLRGERVPYHDPRLRSGLHDLDITHDAASLERAAYEASGFVIRQMLDRAAVSAKRIVASGGGTRVAGWMQAIADATGLPVDIVAVHEGAALGSAYLARMASGLAEDLEGASAWARVASRVNPDPKWQDATAQRYLRFVSLGPGSLDPAD
jgi:xylulokinase